MPQPSYQASLRLEAATKRPHFPAIHVLPVMSLAETSSSNRNMTILKLAFAIFLPHGLATPLRTKIYLCFQYSSKPQYCELSGTSRDYYSSIGDVSAGSSSSSLSDSSPLSSPIVVGPLAAFSRFVCWRTAFSSSRRTARLASRSLCSTLAFS